MGSVNSACAQHKQVKGRNDCCNVLSGVVTVLLLCEHMQKLLGCCRLNTSL